MLDLYKFWGFYFNKSCNNFFKGFYFNKFDFNLVTTSNNLYKSLFILKKKSQFQFSQLVDIFVSDHPEQFDRFYISYSLLSINLNNRLTVKISSSSLNPIISVISIYASANWLEREIWDMFGIFFFFNQSLTRILTDYGFKGHPLRKDFPLTGYFEAFYNDLIKSVVFTKVSLSQDYRNFSFYGLQNIF